MTTSFPPQCWTEEETLSLINAYKERWFALGRGNLRAADWDDVAAIVSSSVGDTSSPKSRSQCQNKIEKLRRRYRAEKQRFLNKPGKFSSSWDLFPLLDAMDFASTPIAVRYTDCRFGHDDEDDGTIDGYSNVLRSRKFESYDRDWDSNLGLGHDFGVTLDDRYREKDYQQSYGGFDSSPTLNQGSIGRFGLKRKYNGNLSSSMDLSRSGGEIGVRLNDDIVPVRRRIRLKSSGEADHSRHLDAEFGHGIGDFGAKRLADRSLVSLRSKPKNHMRFNGNDSSSLDSDSNIDDRADADEVRKRNPGNWDSMPTRSHTYRRSGFSCEVDLGGSSGFRSFTGSGYVKRNANAAKRDTYVIEEVVSSVKSLTNMFVKMETSKMELLRQIEKKRMDMESEHCQTMLEMQQQIVEAFANAIIEKKKKKKDKPEVSISSTMNGECDETVLR